MKKIIKKICSFLKRHKWSVILATLSLVVGGFFIWDILSANFTNEPFDFLTVKEPEVVLFEAPFSGLKITEEQAKKRPLAVVIENHPDSRPQSGLSEADLVFETFAEGGITRFLAIFQSQESKEIGPVRSARSYFVDWALGYDAIFAHAGGSDEAISQIAKERACGVNQFQNSSYFWRSNNRYAPHNVYTTTEKLREAAVYRKYQTEKNNTPALSFKEEKLLEERPETQRFKVNINYSYGPIYTYNKECNCYLRSFESGKHMDVNGKQLSAKNVVIAFSDMGNVVIRNKTYTKIDTTGSGKAFF